MSHTSEEARADKTRTSQSASLGGDSGTFIAPTEGNPQIVGYIDRNARERLRIAFDSYHGHEYLDLRVFAQYPDGDRPTKSGVTVKPGRIRELIHLLVRAADEAERLGLCDDR